MLNVSIERDGEWTSLVCDQLLIRLDAYDQEAVVIRSTAEGEVLFVRDDEIVYSCLTEEP